MLLDLSPLEKILGDKTNYQNTQEIKSKRYSYKDGGFEFGKTHHADAKLIGQGRGNN